MFLIFIYITFLSKGKITKKVNKQLVGMITKCFKEGKEMQIVVIYGVVRNDMNWDVSSYGVIIINSILRFSRNLPQCRFLPLESDHFLPECKCRL